MFGVSTCPQALISCTLLKSDLLQQLYPQSPSPYSYMSRALKDGGCLVRNLMLNISLWDIVLQPRCRTFDFFAVASNSFLRSNKRPRRRPQRSLAESFLYPYEVEGFKFVPVQNAVPTAYLPFTQWVSTRSKARLYTVCASYSTVTNCGKYRVKYKIIAAFFKQAYVVAYDRTRALLRKKLHV